MHDEEITAMRQRHAEALGVDPDWCPAGDCIECRATWPCDTIRALDALEDLAAEADRLRAELAWMTEHRDERTGRLFEAKQRAKKAEARLAAVIAYLDDPSMGDMPDWTRRQIRAAATGGDRG